MFHISAAAGLKSSQSNRERNFGLVLQINAFILVLKSEYRIMNIECRMSNIEGRHSIDFKLKRQSAATPSFRIPHSDFRIRQM